MRCKGDLPLFKKALAKLSILLFLAAFLVPAGRLYAQSSDQDIVVGTDPQPTGTPKAVGDDSTDAMLIEMGVAMLMSL